MECHESLHDSLLKYAYEFQRFGNAVSNQLGHMRDEELVSQQILMIQGRLIAQTRLGSYYQKLWLTGLMKLQSFMIDEHIIHPKVLMKSVQKLNAKLKTRTITLHL